MKTKNQIYQSIKKQIIENKANYGKLCIIERYLKNTDINAFDLSYLSLNQRLILIDIIHDFKILCLNNNKPNIKIKDLKPIDYIDYPINDSYLKRLLSDIDFNTKNDYIIGLKNLLSDNNYNYNTIGLKIVITKFLNDLNDINDLKVLKVKNNYVNDSFKFLVFKNGKTVNYTKLYFNKSKGLIMLNTLLSDNISSVILFDSTKNDIHDIDLLIHKNTINDNNDIDNIDLKKYQYKAKDKEQTLFNLIKYLYYCIDKILNDNNYNYTIDYNKLNVNNKNYKTLLKSIDKHYNDIIVYSDKLLSIYDNIDSILNDIEDFKSNDIGKDSITIEEQNDYYKYDINLNDYFLNP